MRRFSLILTALAITGLLASACDSPTATDDSTITAPSFAAAATVTKVPYTISGPIPCTGEWVEIVGEFQAINQVVTDGSGGFHVTWTWNIKGTGTGSFGNTYRYTHTSPDRINVGADDLPFTHTIADHVVAVSKGSAPNFILHFTIHKTINNNGVVTIDKFERDLHCK
jgi:hypothetical protein